MECRTRIFLFSLLCTLPLFYSATSRAMESPESCPSYRIDGLYEITTPVFDSLKADVPEIQPIASEKTDIDVSTDEKTVSADVLVLDGIDEEKAGFIRRLLPQIEQAREEIGHLISTNIPNSLLVAQAALESGWGTSFGAKNRQNLFGLTKTNGQYMRFSSSLDGLKKYMLTLDQHRAYRILRTQLGKTTNSLELSKYLTKYCNCSGYSNKLNRIIRKNKLAQLDR
ncbi:MAG: glucosaminidase domain-containing protein [Candidatus Gracilibacteria bacterium]|nr:glucosaminidase domain-containing protein [Candidatus Gracilibacteria bacterium]